MSQEVTQRPCIPRCGTHVILCLGWLNIFWKSGGGGSCKGCAVPPAYTQSCPAVIWGVLQLWRRRITKWCTLSTASTKLSISGTRRASSLPYFSLRWPAWKESRKPPAAQLGSIVCGGEGLLDCPVSHSPNRCFRPAPSQLAWKRPLTPRTCKPTRKVIRILEILTFLYTWYFVIEIKFYEKRLKIKRLPRC